MNTAEYSRILTELLKLERLPVAVRFIRKDEKIPAGYRTDLKLNFCQAVMLAQRGEKLLVTGENISCANGGAALGLMPLPEKIKSGEMHSKINVFGTADAAALLSVLTPRIGEGSYAGILLAPLLAPEFDPDVVVIQGTPFNIMSLIMADNHEKGIRYNFTTAASQGVCVDAVVVPFVTGMINTTLGCYGARNATDIREDELLMGIPRRHLDGIIIKLQELNEKLFERARKKPAFNRLREKMDL